MLAITSVERFSPAVLVLAVEESESTKAFFDTIFSTFSDSTVYFMLASVGTVLFLLRMGLMLFAGVGDFDVDADVDADVGDAGFGLFSLLSILAFMMGTGWMGLACRHEWNLGTGITVIIATGFGFALMFASSAAMFQMRKMNQAGRYDMSEAVGKVGKVYLRIPAKGQGAGEVEIDVGGRRSTVPAVSAGEAIDSFASCKVVELRGDGVLIVEPL